MTERIIKYGGIDPLSRTESEHGDAEPDEDPRGKMGTEIVRGVHLMSAAEQLEPAATTAMAYFDPDAPERELGLEEIEARVRDGELSLGDVMTKTSRFTPLVNPRRSRLKRRDELSRDADADLWHVPTSNYQAMPPRQIFEPLAEAIEANDAIDPSGVFGEFRTRRNGGEVHGDIWFADFSVGAIDGDPVRLGFEFRWNYFGDMAFSYQPYAQQTRCKNSVAPLDDRVPVMHHNRSISWREVWTEALEELGLYGDELTQQIQAAREILFDFTGALDVTDGVLPMPMDLETFYRHAGFPDPQIPAEHAREEARNSSDPRESAERINAWHIHAGATYWLSWHWDGSESSRAFREYRRAANDLLFNPDEMAGRVESSYGDEQEREVIRDVLNEGQTLEDADDEQIAEIESRLADHEGIAQISNSVETLDDMVKRFEETEERLERVQEAMSE
jgi:hypothetical protein